ncbi:hypothetical protein BFJ63_vAg16618 [Fusarium oxysporum f. sp. narcissi]|nr:hypothetical protein BFJ63_vAg16618 [Fusarium oxysporum f. sp. narcissi]
MARQDARQRAVSRRPSWVGLQPDRARDADHGRCADRPEIPAVERRRIGHTEKEQFARPKLPALRPGWQRAAQPVGGPNGSHRHAVDPHQRIENANVLRRDCAYTFEQRHAHRQIAALRSECGGRGRQRHQHDAVHGQGTWQRGGAWVERVDAIPADRHAVGRVVDQARQRMNEGRPGQRSEAAGGEAREHDASAQA